MILRAAIVALFLVLAIASVNQTAVAGDIDGTVALGGHGVADLAVADLLDVGDDVADLADAELVGVPYRLTIGPKGVDAGELELVLRATGDKRGVAPDAAVEALVEWTAPVRHELGVPVELMAPNGAQRARASLAQGRAIAEIYRDALAETERTYGPECVPG